METSTAEIIVMRRTAKGAPVLTSPAHLTTSVSLKHGSVTVMKIVQTAVTRDHIVSNLSGKHIRFMYTPMNPTFI